MSPHSRRRRVDCERTIRITDQLFKSYIFTRVVRSQSTFQRLRSEIKKKTDTFIQYSVRSFVSVVRPVTDTHPVFFSGDRVLGHLYIVFTLPELRGIEATFAFGTISLSNRKIVASRRSSNHK
jgi:hypothetical protein